jgi:hypothetical protein
VQYPTLSNYLTLANSPLFSIFALHSTKQYLYTQNTLNLEIRKKKKQKTKNKKTAVEDFDVLYCGGFHGKLSFAWFGKWGTAELKNTQILFLIYNQSQS